MWRKCDLHRHTTAHDGSGFDPDGFVQRCARDGLDVVAVTDHNRIDRIDAVVKAASDHELTVIPGAEISTLRGHVLALAPGEDGQGILGEFCRRVQVAEGETLPFERVTGVLAERVNQRSIFRHHVVLVGAHADKPGSILGPNQAPSVSNQVLAAQQLQALEVVKPENLAAWQRGLKQTDAVMALLQGSDAHPGVEYESRSTWLYLPEVSPQWLRHALATHEASVSHREHPPPLPDFWIASISFEGGPYDGRRIEFSPRANALIGPPSSGKSLIVDAIRYVFDIPCAISDVQSSIERRLAKCLPDGTTVKIEVATGDNRRDLQRVRGGTTTPIVEAKPIVFSQAELARRSMEPTPSVELLDIHCPEGAKHKHDVRSLEDKVQSAFSTLVGTATEAGNLRLEVENEQEGLKATRARYLALVGDEETARSLGDLGRIEDWHKAARLRLQEWREGFEVPAGPELPSEPKLETSRDISDYVPSEAIAQALQEYESSVVDAADALTAALSTEAAASLPRVETLRAAVRAGLGEEQDATPELAAEVEELRARVVGLEQQASQLTRLDDDIRDQLEALDSLVDGARDAWKGLRQARRDACRAVSESMPSFFIRLIQDKLTADVDHLLDDLSTGTYLHESSLRSIRDTLDRKAFVRAAVKRLQFPMSDGEERRSDDSANAQRIARTAVDRRKYDGIARLAVLWPSDGIEIHQLAGDEPVPFDSLTEGLKALAIKEISFAVSQVPAVTDQPEDAVPTTAVFENLVPTVREQRSSRQFIIASHDANVVVSGDMERVVVLPPDSSEEPVAGTLFDASIRRSAIALLEGGDRAFDLRRRRYGDYG